MASPERIVILNDFSSATGGAGYLATTLAAGMAARGLPVTFIAGDNGPANPPAGIDWLALGGMPLLVGSAGRAAMRGIYNRAAAAGARDWIARNDTPRTVYHLHNWSNILSPSIFDALAPVARRCVIHAHDFFLACPNGSYLDFPRAEVCQRVPLSPGCLTTNCDKRAYAHKVWRATRHRMLFSRLGPHLRAARFVMINEAMRPWLTRAIRPAHLIAIANPVTPFGPPARAPETQNGVVHIGQVQRLKGVHDLAQAGRRLGLSVSFFGNGEDLEVLRAGFPEHHWHGFTSREDIARHLQEARVVVVATQSPEPFCLAAFESLATGVPLVLSDAILAAGDLVQRGLALGFRAGDVTDLTRALTCALGDDALIAQLAARARAQGATLGNDLPTWAAAHTDLYADLVSEDCRALS
ncbi:glycosyltransferase family 4 protein [Oceaniglobus trochenteri]|uniref:glycosyltransferase family 4 protein n=1 Tax=Oceaniglobus trochenteri TaxID=2763260 RepID=UPI001D000EF3|nr:glycosyltransferase family 4 protein [Oceaniglobus trochenteri]